MNYKFVSKNISNLSIIKLKEKIKNLREDLPKDNRNTITFSKNFTLSLSNYCINQCNYCYYNHRIESKKNTILLDLDNIKNITNNALQYECKEGLILSGEKPDSFPEVKEKLERWNIQNYITYIKDICDYLLDKSILPHINIGLMKFKDFILLKEFTASMGLMLESTCLRLYKNGGVHQKSPSKLPNVRIDHIIKAGKLKIPFTTGLLLGIGEDFKDRIKDLLLIKKIHEKYGHIQEVILQKFESKEVINYKPKNELSIKEYLKITAIARIIFRNEIPIQVPPNLIKGFEKEFIEMGVNDFGGISPITPDFINPKKKWPQIDKLKHICNNLGYNLKERLPIYKKFITKRFFLSNRIKNIIENYSDKIYN